MHTERVTATSLRAEAFGALRPTDFEFNASGKLSISDTALTAAIGRNCRPSWQRSSRIIIPIPPWPWS
jgi:hypothetical protein